MLQARGWILSQKLDVLSVFTSSRTAFILMLEMFVFKSQMSTKTQEVWGIIRVFKVLERIACRV